jgi:transcriptional regulator with XRE-family HTH domain
MYRDLVAASLVAGPPLRLWPTHVRLLANMTDSRPAITLGAQIRDARVRADISLRELARRIERAPSYINDIEHDRRVPSEPVLRQICGELGLDEDRLLAAAGRVGEGAEEYMKANPTAGVLFRRVSTAGLGEQDLNRLLNQADKLIRERDKRSDKNEGTEK